MSKPYKSTGFTITTKQHATLQKIKDKGYFPSISSIMRYCLNIGLPQVIKEVNQLDQFIHNNDIISVFKYLQANGFTIYKLRQNIKSKPLTSIYINGENKVIQ